MLNEIKKFLFELLMIYPIFNKDGKEKLITDTSGYLYDNLAGKEIDFEKAKKLLFEGYDRKSFPSPNEILHFLKKAVIPKQNQTPKEECWYLLTLKSGRKYSFYPDSFGKTQEEYRKEWTEKFGEFTLQICPPESALIGNELFIPTSENVEEAKRRFYDLCRNPIAKRIPNVRKRM